MGDTEVWLCCFLAVGSCASPLTSWGFNGLTRKPAHGIECSVRREAHAADDPKDASQGSTGCCAPAPASGKSFERQQGEAWGAKRKL